MIRASIIALSLLVAVPAFAAPETEGHTHETPAYVYTEAPTDRAYGNADADHTLIIYASNVCPHCGSWFANDWPVVKSDLIETGKLRFIFRPLSSQPLQLSLTGFLMAECAAEGEYMRVIEDQFARQNTILKAAGSNDGAMIKSQYDAVAKVAGLDDTASIAACLSEETHLKTLQASADRAGAAGISNIPSFIFNGAVMSGASDADAIKGWVEGRSSARP
jgi:protein-disulfide isomerase